MQKGMSASLQHPVMYWLIMWTQKFTNADIISDDSNFTPGNGDTNGNAHRINKADAAGNIDGFMRVDVTGNNDVQVGYQYKLEMNTAVDNSAIPKVTVHAIPY